MKVVSNLVSVKLRVGSANVAMAPAFGPLYSMGCCLYYELIKKINYFHMSGGEDVFMISHAVVI